MSDKRFSSSRRKILGATGLALAGAATGTSVTSASKGSEHGTDSDGDATKQEVMEIISDWEQKQQTETEKTMEKYGVPEGITERRLIWYDVDPWKRIEIFKEATLHNFPTPHPDFFEQVIDYHVPPDKADELTEYDGSVMFERTTGELSARCHTEWANFLAINLADAVITDEMSVKEARRAYAQDVIAKMNGETPPRTQGFQFELPEGSQADRDEAIIQDGEIVLDEC